MLLSLIVMNSFMVWCTLAVFLLKTIPNGVIWVKISPCHVRDFLAIRTIVMILVSPSKLFNLLQYQPQHPVLVDASSRQDFARRHIRRALLLDDLKRGEYDQVESSVVVMSPTQLEPELIAKLDATFPRAQRPIGYLSCSPAEMFDKYPFLCVSSSDGDHSEARCRASLQYPSEFLDEFVFVASILEGANAQMLARLEISAILDCTPKSIPDISQDLGRLLDRPIAYKHIPPSNYPSASMAAEWFLAADDLMSAVDFVEQSTGRVLVVDFDAVSLSPTIAVAVKHVRSRKAVPWCVSWGRSRSGRYTPIRPQLRQLVAFAERIATAE